MNPLEALIFRHHLLKDEEALHVIHAHWVTFSKQFFRVNVFGILLPLLLLLFVTGFSSQLSWFLYAWLGFGLMMLGYNFLDWYGDAWILTEECILGVRWDGFFNQSSTRLHFWDVADVEYTIKGVRQRMLRYGDLSVDKVVGGNMEFQNVAHPKQTADLIARVKSASYEFRKKHQQNAMKEVLLDMIDEAFTVERKE
jgi:hypothetical protein